MLTQLQRQQLEREKQFREELLGKRERDDQKLLQSGRGAQTLVAKGFLQTLVPGVAYWIDKHIESAKRRSNNCGQAIKEVNRLATWVDSMTLAHIGTSVVLDSLGRGTSFRCSITKVQMDIGRQIEDQAFISFMEEVDPKYYARLKKLYLNDPIRTYQRKVYVMKFTLDRNEEMSWKWMEPTEHARVGALVLRAIMSVPIDGYDEGLFETKNVRQSKTKTVNYLAFSQTGIRYRDVIAEMMEQVLYKPQPMTCPPIPWTLTERGGYLLQPPGSWGQLVHNNFGSIPSQTALDAINRLQAQPYKINEFILDTQLALLQKSYEIGSFRSFEKSSWSEEHFPVYDSGYIDSLEKGSDEYREVMKKLKEAYHQQKLDEKTAVTPRRIVYLAEQYRDVTFYTPWFFCSRLRSYSQTELSIQQADYVKALLVNANPKPITETTREDLLIAIATSGDFEKMSKKTYPERIKWSEEFIKSPDYRQIIDDPIRYDFWHQADEPFLFLSYCEELDAIESGRRNTTRVWVQRDMSCSGIQILSSIMGDRTAMEATNVLPDDKLNDAYQVVADAGQTLLQDKNWLSEKYQKFKDDNEKWNKKNPKREPRVTKFKHDIPLNEVDRGIAKKPVMLTSYNGSTLTKSNHIVTEIRDRKLNLEYQDERLVVSCLLEGMSNAFPKYEELGKWFKAVVKAALGGAGGQLRWTTPNGSIIVQDYREPLFTKVQTHCASGGHYSKLMSTERGEAYVLTGWGETDVKSHSTAAAANFTHSLDGCIIQNGVTRLAPEVDCVTIHDCLLYQPGYTEKVVPVFRKAFYGVVTTPVLSDLLEENNVSEELVGDPTNVQPDLNGCLNSQYMFS